MFSVTTTTLANRRCSNNSPAHPPVLRLHPHKLFSNISPAHPPLLRLQLSSHNLQSLTLQSKTSSCKTKRCKNQASGTSALRRRNISTSRSATTNEARQAERADFSSTPAWTQRAHPQRRGVRSVEKLIYNMMSTRTLSMSILCLMRTIQRATLRWTKYESAPPQQQHHRQQNRRRSRNDTDATPTVPTSTHAARPYGQMSENSLSTVRKSRTVKKEPTVKTESREQLEPIVVSDSEVDADCLSLQPIKPEPRPT